MAHISLSGLGEKRKEPRTEKEYEDSVLYCTVLLYGVLLSTTALLFDDAEYFHFHNIKFLFLLLLSTARNYMRFNMWPTWPTFLVGVRQCDAHASRAGETVNGLALHRPKQTAQSCRAAVVRRSKPLRGLHTQTHFRRWWLGILRETSLTELSSESGFHIIAI